MRVPFSQANITALEHSYVRAALESGALRAGGPYTQQCQALLAAPLRGQAGLLTNSATAARDMALLLGNIGPGDEVILRRGRRADRQCARCRARPCGASVRHQLRYLFSQAARGATPQRVPRRACARGIEATSHYIPLDLTPGGKRFARVAGSLAATDAAADRLVRLPLWYGMDAPQEQVIDAVLAELG
jgi:dTDP-4-amino-4,6-dideoxygalactose transaminase